MIETAGYPNKAFVTPDRAPLAKAGAIPLAGMTTLASRYFQGFFLRHGWAFAADLTDLPEIDPNQGPGSNPTNRPMRILLA